MVSLGKLKGKMPEELPMPAAPAGEVEGAPMEEGVEEIEEEVEPIESPLAEISDEELLAEIEKRGLKPGAAAPAPAGAELPV